MTLSRHDGPAGASLLWRIPARPARPCHLELREREPFFVGAATLVDARGARRNLETHRADGVARWELNPDALEGLEFPVTLDPLFGPLLTASVARQVPVSRTAMVATLGAEWLAAGSSGQTGVLARLFNVDGRPAQQVTLSDAPAFFFATNRYHLIGTEWRSGTSFVDLSTGPVRARPAVMQGVDLRVFPCDGGALVTSSITAPDGGFAFYLRRAGNDLEWDGGQTLVRGALRTLAIEADRAYVHENGTNTDFKLIDFDGALLKTVSLDAGLSVNSLVASDGADTTLIVVSRSDIFGRIYNEGQLLSSGNALGPPFPLDDGANRQIATGLFFDGVTFRFYVTQDASSMLEEWLIRRNGTVTGPTPVAGPFNLSMTNVAAMPVAMSRQAGSALLAFNNGVTTDVAVRAMVVPPGQPGPRLAGATLFTGPNSAFGPRLVRRGSEFLVVWNDTSLGGESVELFGRRFDLDLNPIDADSAVVSLGTDGGSEHNLYASLFLTNGVRPMAATLSGYHLLRTDAFTLTLHSLDAAGRPNRPELRLSTPFMLILGGTVVSNGKQSLISWLELQGSITPRLHLYDDVTGQLSAPLTVPNELQTTVPLPNGDFVLLSGTTSTLLSLDGGEAPAAWTAPSGLRFFDAVARDNAIDVSLLDSTGQHFSVGELLLDGGLGAVREVTNPDQRTWQQLRLAHDGHRLFVLGGGRFPDGGFTNDFFAALDDGGWSAPQPVLPTLRDLWDFAAIPDAGLVLARGNPPGPAVLQRVQWLEPGAACGAPSDCVSGFCVDGVCCDSACGGGAVDCQACAASMGATADGTCTLLAASVTCRAAASACDVAETCNGTSLVCPPDVLADAGTACRASSGACDVADVCDGVSPLCADAFADAGVACRAASGTCDAPDVCDGLSATCTDSAADAGVPCRAAVDVCDAPEVCDGVATSCPMDLASDAGLPQCAPTALVFDAPSPPACGEARTVTFTLSGRAPTQLDFVGDPAALDLSWDGGTLQWTPSTSTPTGTVRAVADGRELAQLELTSNCGARGYQVGCGCSSIEGTLGLGLALAAWGRRLRRRGGQA